MMIMMIIIISIFICLITQVSYGSLKLTDMDLQSTFIEGNKIDINNSLYTTA